MSRVCWHCRQDKPLNAYGHRRRICDACLEIATRTKAANRKRYVVRGPLEKRFWAKVQKTANCWLWTACRLPPPWDYGQMGRSDRAGGLIRAHVASWIIHNGEIPPGLLVLHKCDNPPCVRPDHLFLGTHADNIADMIAKGRYGGPRQLPRGASHHNAKLTEVAVHVIRSSLMSNTWLAERFGVSDDTVRLVKRRKIWTHI